MAVEVVTASLERSKRSLNTRSTIALLLCSTALCAQNAQTTAPQQAQDENLAKQLANPVASLISVPIQSNFDFGVGAANRGFRYTANLQPVVPFRLTPSLNLITRTILPVVYQSDVFAPLNENDGGQSGVYAGQGTQAGLGDATASFFLSPSAPVKGLIIGIGPVFLAPTATDRYLGTGKWGVGPTLVVLKQKGQWTGGALYNHIFSFAGQSSRGKLSSSFLQPFLSYTFKNTTTLGVNLESTYDFAGGNGWTVPINFTAGKIFKFGRQLTNISVGARYYAARPEAAPEWGLRFTTTLLFPRS